MSCRKIIHVDMDCFYAAVEIKHRPELRGKPVGIGGPARSRSVLCTANYEARKFKVRAAMSTTTALRLCPSLILIPPHFELYQKESRAVHEIFARFSSKIEPLSLDEAYLDVTDSPHFGGSATLIALEIRKLIQKELCLTASAGISTNKFVAKVASDWNKPNGQFVVRPEEVDDFVKGLPVEKIFGVGPVTAKKMHELGLLTCADIQKQSILQMTRWFGAQRGAELKGLGSRDRSLDPSKPVSERKSLTVEADFSRSTCQTLQEALLQAIPALYQSWAERMRTNAGLGEIRGFVVKVKYFDFKTMTHEMASPSWPSIQDFKKLLSEVWTRRSDPIRLIGLGVRLGKPLNSENLDLDLDLNMNPICLREPHESQSFNARNNRFNKSTSFSQEVW
jgi:DNA polymerase-4